MKVWQKIINDKIPQKLQCPGLLIIQLTPYNIKMNVKTMFTVVSKYLQYFVTPGTKNVSAVS